MRTEDARERAHLPLGSRSITVTGIVPTSNECMGSLSGKEVIRAEPSTPVMRNASLWAKRHSFVCWSSLFQLADHTEPDGTNPVARGQL